MAIASASLGGAATAMSSSAQIPFRTAAATSGHDLTGVMVATVALLLIASSLAWFSRRMGWLDRWTSSKSKSVAVQRTLRIEQSLRVSRKTTLHRVADGDERYLLVESDTQVQWLPLSGNGVGREQQ